MKRCFQNLLFIILISSANYQFSCAQSYADEISKFQNELNQLYENSETTPLMEEDFPLFQGHEFYPINEDYNIHASFKRTADAKPFEMITTGKKRPLYIEYGRASFELDGEAIELIIYQNVMASKMIMYKDDLFLAYHDLTNGESTYGGGRFIDLKKPVGNVINIDFNRSFNPLCAYNPEKYSCPIPPPQNNIPVEITAGVKFSEKDY